MHTKSKRNPIVANWGVENETIVFLINEGLNRERENVVMETKEI